MNKITYGIHPISELINNRENQIEHIYFSKKKAYGKNLFKLLKSCKKRKIAYNLTSQQHVDQIAQTKKNQGVVAVASEKELIDEVTFWTKINSGEIKRIILPSLIKDTRNLGSMIRSAVAFGFKMMLLERKGSAPINSTTIKTSTGMIEHIDILKPKKLANLLKNLKEKGFSIVYAEKKKKNLRQFKNKTERLVLITGGEHKGVPAYLKKVSDSSVRIDISEMVDSLNVSIAASILMYHFSDL